MRATFAIAMLSVLNMTMFCCADEPFDVPALTTNSLGLTTELADQWDESARSVGRPKSGVFVKHVEPGGPATRETVVSHGSWVTRVNNKKVTTPSEFDEAVQATEPGVPIKLEVRMSDRRKSDGVLVWKQPKTIKLTPEPLGQMCLKACRKSEQDNELYELNEGWIYPFVAAKFREENGHAKDLFWRAGITTPTNISATSLTVQVGKSTYQIEQQSERDRRINANTFTAYETMEGKVNSQTKRMLWDLAFGKGPATAKWSGILTRQVEVTAQNRHALRVMLCAYLELGGVPLGE